MDELDFDIILSLADNNMNITKVARIKYMHRNTVVYHINKVKNITGLDPTNFYDLHKLVEMVRERRK